MGVSSPTETILPIPPSYDSTTHMNTYTLLYNGLIPRDLSRPMRLMINLPILLYIVEIFFPLGMSQGLVRIAAGCFRLRPTGSGWCLFDHELLSDVWVQGAPQSTGAGNLFLRWPQAGPEFL
jgi:hypothetical protein